MLRGPVLMSVCLLSALSAVDTGQHDPSDKSAPYMASCDALGSGTYLIWPESIVYLLPLDRGHCNERICVIDLTLKVF